MNKTIGIIIAVIVVVGGIYLFTHKKTGDQTKSGTESSATAQTEAQPQSTSLKSLMASGGSQKCTFTSGEGNATSQGTFYVSNGKSRGDIQVMSKVGGDSSVNTTTHMISDGTTSYVWTDGSATGYKMKIDVSAQQSNQANQSVDPNKNYDFSCSSWSADSSMFTPPASVQFNDMTVPPVPPGASAGTSAAAGANYCLALSGTAKAECEAAMKK